MTETQSGIGAQLRAVRGEIEATLVEIERTPVGSRAYYRLNAELIDRMVRWEDTLYNLIQFVNAIGEQSD